MSSILVTCETGRQFETRNGELETVVLVLGQNPGYASVLNTVLHKAGVDFTNTVYFSADFDPTSLEINNINTLGSIGLDGLDAVWL